MQRYYKRSREECFDADGWFHTGDLVRTDADGFVYFIGRRGAMIKTAGANVAPAEVERAIAKVTGGTVAHVIGLPDPERGQLVAAVVALEDDAEFDEAAVRDRLKAELSAYKIPKRFAAVPRSDIPVLVQRKGRPRRATKGVRCLTPSTGWCRLGAEQHWNKPMVIDPESRISYAQLDGTTRALAAAFIEAGVGKGTRVGLIMPNRVQWVQIAMALTRIGAVLVPLSTLLQPPELVAQLRAASVQVLIAVEEFRGHRYLDDLADVLTSAKLPALRKVWTPEQIAASHDDQMVEGMAAAATPSDTLVIMFTSGSSGPPKGVIHSHGNALAAVRSGLDCPLHRCGHPAVSADAVLLGGRLRQRRTVRPAGRRHARDGGDPAAGDDVAPVGTRAGLAVSRLARPGGGVGTAIRICRSRFVRVTAGQSGGAAAARPPCGSRVRGRSCSG